MREICFSVQLQQNISPLYIFGRPAQHNYLVIFFGALTLLFWEVNPILVKYLSYIITDINCDLINCCA